MQRRKGVTNEYLVRNLLRAEGYIADRVPCSGAAQGKKFKGDLVGVMNGQEFIFEVKSRAKAFTSVYNLFNANAVAGLLCVALEKEGKDVLCRISANSAGALQSEGLYSRPEAMDKRLRGKLLTMQKWVKDCDVLVIKDDRQPPLYLRYLNEVNNE